MRITAFSDTHGFHHKAKIEPTELLIFAGDCMTSGYGYPQLISFLDWFKLQPAKYRVMIAGNHDRVFENYPDTVKDILNGYPEITYLEDSSVDIEGYKIYGTPHSKIFYNWAFNRSEEDLERLFSRIPSDTDILVSHAPPYGVLDQIIGGESVGEKTLSKRIHQLKNLKLHVFGHIHNSFGMIKPHGRHISINASQVDESYDCVNFPLQINL